MPQMSLMSDSKLDIPSINLDKAMQANEKAMQGNDYEKSHHDLLENKSPRSLSKKDLKGISRFFVVAFLIITID
jgi:hypothetical protein